MLIDWLMNLAIDKIKNKFTGKIVINFFNGGVTNVMIEESVRPPVELTK